MAPTLVGPMLMVAELTLGRSSKDT